MSDRLFDEIKCPVDETVIPRTMHWCFEMFDKMLDEVVDGMSEGLLKMECLMKFPMECRMFD